MHLDLRPLTAAAGVSVDDVAKRLVDFGFHAPTVSFPAAGTLMVEPTEFEDLPGARPLRRRYGRIRAEIDQVAAGDWPVEDSPMRGAPRTAADLVGDWELAYSREVAVLPGGTRPDKYWPPVGRIEQAHGDRNLICTCPPLSAFEI